jgi:hypothetical protein
MRRGVLCTAVLLLALGAAPPANAGLDKVLVIGTDGTRWDLLDQAMRAGKAPNLKRLRASGFGRPSLLRYQPSTYTLSEVGWSSIASGVWETKHGVDGHLLNMDPGQATKNGYLDFLTRVERLRPSLDTYLASDWDNIGLPLNGGPIFGSAMDVNYAARVPAETIDNWNAGDAAVTKAAERYLRDRDPDAAFVYLGLVDETAHLAGSATPTYASAIATTDKRIGRILRAVRARPTYPFESWTILVTTDHGQKPLSEPSIVSHFGHTKLELTSFVFGSGPGLTARIRKPLVVDVNPTVLHQLGLPVKRSWELDGHTLSKAKPPSSASAKLRGHRLTVRLKLGSPPKARNVSVRLPARVRKLVGGSVNRRLTGWTAEGRRVVLRVPGGRLRTLSLTADVAGRGSGSVAVALRDRKLAIPIR